MKRVCIVIPMYGKSEYTRKCVDMTIANAGIDSYDILVVDDGSPDQYTDDRVIHLRLKENTGYTNATNQGILWAGERYEYILCLNNDTEPEAGFLSELVSIMDADPTVGIAGSIRTYLDGRIELCGADLIRGHQYFADANLPETPMEVNWFPICSGLLRVQMIREIGVLDKRFRNHCSDSDYCLRAKINGWKVVLAPKSRVLHYLSVTTKENKVDPDLDQRKFIEKLAGMDYAQIMKVIPLDASINAWGKIEFNFYQK
jgi:GT2 family glycosyltransferase